MNSKARVILTHAIQCLKFGPANLDYTREPDPGDLVAIEILERLYREIRYE